MVAEDKIRKLSERLVKGLDPERIFLFGSYAWGQPTEDSDVDLLVVQESNLPRRQRQLTARRLLLEEDIAVDVLVYTPEEFARENGMPNTLAEQASKQGKLIYDRG